MRLPGRTKNRSLTLKAGAKFRTSSKNVVGWQQHLSNCVKRNPWPSISKASRVHHGFARIGSVPGVTNPADQLPIFSGRLLRNLFNRLGDLRAHKRGPPSTRSRGG